MTETTIVVGVLGLGFAAWAWTLRRQLAQLEERVDGVDDVVEQMGPPFRYTYKSKRGMMKIPFNPPPLPAPPSEPPESDLASLHTAIHDGRRELDLVAKALEPLGKRGLLTDSLHCFDSAAQILGDVLPVGPPARVVCDNGRPPRPPAPPDSVVWR